LLNIDLRPGQSISIGSSVITLESKSGQVARLSIVADKSIPVRRVMEQGGIAQLAAEQGITRKA
jgi:hypothetical protein